MKIVDFAVKRPVTMTIVVAVVIILGFFTLSRMVLDLFPEMKFPMALVYTTYSGSRITRNRTAGRSRQHGGRYRIGTIILKCRDLHGPGQFRLGYRYG